MIDLFSLPNFLAALATVVSLFAGQIIYNLRFHPLARFPGPKLAACSRLWLAYRELVRGESLSDLRAELHRQYGEIVRLAPNELHFSNPSAYHDIYNNKNKWDKDNSLYRAFEMDAATVGFVHYADAKHRREILGPFFSRTSTLQMQDLVQERVNVFCDALAQQFAAGKSSDFVLGFQCCAVDIITAFCYAKNWDTTKAPDFNSKIVLAFQAALPILTMRKYSSTVIRVMRFIPPWFGKKVGSPVTRSLFVLRGTLKDQVREILRNPGSLENASHRTIYHALLDPDANKGLPLPTKLSLFQEAGALLGAGSDSTSITATTISYHVLHNTEALQQLVKELRTAWPVLDEVPRYEVLEKLPYLTAVIKEGLRMFPGFAALPRVVPPEGATIGGAFIPGGTIVGESFVYVHRSPAVFSDPDTFIPNRWLGEDSKTLEASLCTFSKGPRNCIGVNLAYCELSFLIANLFRRFDVTLDTERTGDLTFVEHFVPVFKNPHLRAYCRPVSD